MSSEIVVPFSLDGNGSVNATTDANLQINQHLKSLVATGPGERVMLPTYGVPLRNTIFAPYDNLQATMLQAQISNALGTWEPNIDISGVQITPTGGAPSGEVGVNVNWIPRAPTGSGTGIQTAVILVGGTVVEA